MQVDFASSPVSLKIAVRDPLEVVVDASAMFNTSMRLSSSIRQSLFLTIDTEAHESIPTGWVLVDIEYIAAMVFVLHTRA